MFMSGFFAGVYSVVSHIPAGKVATYGQIAMMLGSPGAARTVGWAMRAAPPGLPCHRVVNQKGELSPVDIFGGIQRELLEREGVPFLPGGRIDLRSCLWDGK
jgi:methylated-DNA-protein-cysteine methyltransferase-like protein